MKWRWSFLLLITLLIPFPVGATSEFYGKVIAIIDGDTIEVLHNRRPERIRLTGIDCPEKKQAFGNRAKQATSNLSFGQNVTIQPTGKDRYGRTLATVMLRDGKNLNRELVKEGWCWWYRKYAPDYAVLQTLEAEAHLAKKGLWVDANPVPPWIWRKKGQQVKYGPPMR
ncbi:MAG: thermonuclease family protein [Nitrospira sp. BO4]|nr:thermonuclease family protein [Nitrospira sp. BO4]